MDESPRDLAVDRRTVLAGGAALAVGLAGCNDESGDRADPEDTLTYVPATASVVVGVDMALTDNEETRSLVESYTDGDGDDLLERVERETGVDPEDLDEALAFSETPGPEGRTLVVDVDDDLDEGAVAESVEAERGVEYEPVEYDNGTLYEPTGGDGDEPWIGTAAEGQYVVGSESDVRTALDVFAGDADGLADPLRGAFEDAREGQGDGDPDDESESESDDDQDDDEEPDGDAAEDDHVQYVTSATDRPREYLPDDDSDEVPAGVSLDLYEDLETATATYAAADGEVAIDVDLRAPDEETAGRIEDFTGTIVAVLQNSLEGEAAAELSQASVDREGTVVTVAYRSDVEGAASLAEWLSEM